MPIIFHLPAHLSALTGGANPAALPASPATVGGALELLWRRYPGLRDRLADEQGKVREHINVFVGDECIRFTGGLAAPVPESAELFLVAAVSGGQRRASQRSRHSRGRCGGKSGTR